MGTATIGAYTLNSVTKVTRGFKKTNAEHEIPGTASIVQAVGRKRDLVKIYGILNPSSEILAVEFISQIPNTTAISASAVTDVAGTDWLAAGGNTYFVQDVQTGTKEGTRVPWGNYEITLIEVT